MAGGFDDDTLPAEGMETHVDPVALQPGDLVDGRYRLVQLLGVGGMGEVWQVEHIALRRALALKVLRAAELASDQQRARFLREAQVVAAIQHRGIIDITDFGELPSGAPFIAMSLLTGRTLLQVLTDDGPLPWPRVVTLIGQIADALAEAHRNEVVHRDLKPENVFVSPGPPEHATVIDFGIARCTTLDARAAKLTATGSVFGSPGYMSPEQIRGDPADGRADIYALGCVTHELLTGRRLFDGELFERLEAHLNREPPPLPQSLPPGLVRIVERCLAKSPDDRFRSMAEVTSALSVAAGRTGKRTEVVPGHFPVAPLGVRTEASRPTAPAVVQEFTAPLTATAATPGRQSTPRGVVVAVASAVVGFAVLALLYAAWSLPGASPASTTTPADATPTKPPVPIHQRVPDSPPTVSAPVAHPAPTVPLEQGQPHTEPERVEEPQPTKPKATKRTPTKRKPTKRPPPRKSSGPKLGDGGLFRDL